MVRQVQEALLREDAARVQLEAVGDVELARDGPAEEDLGLDLVGVGEADAVPVGGGAAADGAWGGQAGGARPQAELLLRRRTRRRGALVFELPSLRRTVLADAVLDVAEDRRAVAVGIARLAHAFCVRAWRGHGRVRSEFWDTRWDLRRDHRLASRCSARDTDAAARAVGLALDSVRLRQRGHSVSRE